VSFTGHTPEARRRISKGLKQYYARRRETSLTRPSHVDTWKRTGVITPQLRPIVERRAAQVEAMVQDLGGPSEVTAMQRATLDTWIQAMVGADTQFQRLLTGEVTEVPERLVTCLNAARAALVVIGMERRQREVASLSDYLAAKKAEDAPRATNSEQPALDADLVEDAPERGVEIEEAK